jgi:hypothetical protein
MNEKHGIRRVEDEGMGHLSMIPNMIGILMLMTDPEAATGSQGYILLFYIMTEGTPPVTGISRDRRR